MATASGRRVVYRGQDISGLVIGYEIKPPHGEILTNIGLITHSDVTLFMIDGPNIHTDTSQVEITVYS